MAANDCYGDRRAASLPAKTDEYVFCPDRTRTVFFSRSSGYNGVSVDNRFALCNKFGDDIEAALESGPLI